MNRLTLCGALALLAASPSAQPRPRAPLPPMRLPSASDRVLVIAPHPDDETLCCAGYLQWAVRAGATVGVVWITAGDSFEIDAMLTERTLRPRSAGLEQLGLRRIAEGHAAADLLGVPRANQFLLGFPDRDIAALLQHPQSDALRSRYTGASAVPYSDALRPGDPYTGEALRANLREIIDRFAPTIVLAPSLLDRHPDHSSSGALAQELLGAGQQTGKLTALHAHHTQMEVMSLFLHAFVRTNEIYAPAP